MTVLAFSAHYFSWPQTAKGPVPTPQPQTPLPGSTSPAAAQSTGSPLSANRSDPFLMPLRCSSQSPTSWRWRLRRASRSGTCCGATAGTAPSGAASLRSRPRRWRGTAAGARRMRRRTRPSWWVMSNLRGGGRGAGINVSPSCRSTPSHTRTRIPLNPTHCARAAARQLEIARGTREAWFCAQPPGDQPLRKAMYDSMLLGAIPVLFEPFGA